MDESERLERLVRLETKVDNVINILEKHVKREEDIIERFSKKFSSKWVEIVAVASVGMIIAQLVITIIIK